MDKRLWYKMLGKEDAFDRSTYYKVNEEPIKLKKLLKKERVSEIMTPHDNLEVHTDRIYILQRKTVGDYYAGGNIHAPTTTMDRGSAAKISGTKIKDMKYNWPMSWDLIDLTEEPGEDNLGGEKVNEDDINELHFTGETLNKVRQDVFNFIRTEHKKLGYTNPLDTYHLIQQVLDSGKMNVAAKKIR